MSKQPRQYRFYSESDTSHNSPANISFARLTSGSIFFSDGTLGSIVTLGIQALPGTKFYINDGASPIMIGTTGIYELDVEGQTEITSLSFDATSISAISANDNAYLIVDAIYQGEDE